MLTGERGDGRTITGVLREATMLVWLESIEHIAARQAALDAVDAAGEAKKQGKRDEQRREVERLRSSGK